jgi:hypothetical protein
MIGAAALACDGTGDAPVYRPQQHVLAGVGQASDGAADLLHAGHDVRWRDRRATRPSPSPRPSALGGPTAVSDGPRGAWRLLHRLPERIKGWRGRRLAAPSCTSGSCAGWPPTTSGHQAGSRAATRHSCAPCRETRARAVIASGPWQCGAGWSLGARLAGKPTP